MTDKEIETLLSAEQYGSVAEAVAAAQAFVEPGEEIQLHAEDCEVVDGETGEGCTCEPIVVEYKPRAKG